MLIQEWRLKTCLILVNGSNEVGCELDGVWRFGMIHVVEVLCDCTICICVNSQIFHPSGQGWNDRDSS